MPELHIKPNKSDRCVKKSLFGFIVGLKLILFSWIFFERDGPIENEIAAR